MRRAKDVDPPELAELTVVDDELGMDSVELGQRKSRKNAIFNLALNKLLVSHGCHHHVARFGPAISRETLVLNLLHMTRSP